MAGQVSRPDLEANDAADAAETWHRKGLELLAAQEFTAAETALKHSLSLRLSVMTLYTLAGVQWSLNNYPATEQTLEQLLAQGDLSAKMEEHAYLRLAKLKSSRGDEAGATALLLQARARTPRNVNYAVAHADIIAATDVVRARAELEQLLQTPGLPDADISNVLAAQTHHGATINRQVRGLSITIAESWKDCVGWDDRIGAKRLLEATKKELGPSGGRAGAVMNLALIYALIGEWDAADAVLTQIRTRNQGTYANIAKFGRDHFAALEGMTDDAVLEGLAPNVEIVAPAPGTGPCLYLASDPVYFRKFTKPFLRALDEHGATCDVHVHLLDGDPAMWQREAEDIAKLTRRRVSLSAEASDAADRYNNHARVYYHAIRFVRFYEALKRWGRPMWLLDVDVGLRGDPTALLAKLNTFDVAMRGRACAFTSWSKLSACCVGVAPTARGLEYARLVAAYIMDAKRTETWMWSLDQMALFAAYVHLQRMGRMPHTWFLQDDLLTINSDGDAPLRFVSGVYKYIAQEL
jgi:tetratricopeptide (TPR) repeat protein